MLQDILLRWCAVDCRPFPKGKLKRRKDSVFHEDWELWARAVLNGYALQVVPEALYWYRLGGGGMLSESIGGSHLAQVSASSALHA